MPRGRRAALSALAPLATAPLVTRVTFAWEMGTQAVEEAPRNVAGCASKKRRSRTSAGISSYLDIGMKRRLDSEAKRMLRAIARDGHRQRVRRMSDHCASSLSRVSSSPPSPPISPSTDCSRRRTNGGFRSPNEPAWNQTVGASTPLAAAEGSPLHPSRTAVTEPSSANAPRRSRAARARRRQPVGGLPPGGGRPETGILSTRLAAAQAKSIPSKRRSTSRCTSWCLGSVG